MLRSDEQRARGERLARAFEDAGAPTYASANARNGVCDKFYSSKTNRDAQNLTGYGRKLELLDIARRALDGEFDAPEPFAAKPRP